MDEVKDFVDKWMEAERNSVEKKRSRDIDEYNKSLDHLFEYSASESIKFGMNYRSSPLSDMFYEIEGSKPPPSKRHLYKITKYEAQEYGFLYAVYVSKQDPIPGAKTLSDCYFVASVEGEYSIVAHYVFGDPDLADPTWRFVGGDRDIQFDTLGEPVEIERIQPPEDEEESMEEYNRDR